MRNATLWITTVILLCGGSALGEETTKPVNAERRMEWFREARFGMFVHWGLYAVLAGEYEGTVKG